MGRVPTTTELAEQLEMSEEAVLEVGVASSRGARVGFSHMHISRLQRRALARMRAQLVES